MLLFLQKNVFACWHYKKIQYPVPWHLFPLKLSGFAVPPSLPSMPAGFSAPAPPTVTVALGVPCFSSAFQAELVVLFFFSPYLLDSGSPLDVCDRK